MANLQNINELVAEYLDTLYYPGYAANLKTDAFEFEKANFIDNHLNAA